MTRQDHGRPLHPGLELELTHCLRPHPFHDSPLWSPAPLPCARARAKQAPARLSAVAVAAARRSVVPAQQRGYASVPAEMKAAMIRETGPAETMQARASEA